MATYSAGQQVSVTELGLVRPLDAGNAALQVEFQSMQQQVPITVNLSGDKGPIDFVQDVNPLLARLGCNSGTC
ncbi:MAG TPA: hypothetical protein P5307_28410, partial [Pirellulaceae bacterium]|nr:hypothetical protein [Pirellulaceae bacterium]